MTILSTASWECSSNPWIRGIHARGGREVQGDEQVLGDGLGRGECPEEGGDFEVGTETHGLRLGEPVVGAGAVIADEPGEGLDADHLPGRKLPDGLEGRHEHLVAEDSFDPVPAAPREGNRCGHLGGAG